MVRPRGIGKKNGDTSPAGLLGQHLGVRTARGGNNPCHAGFLKLGDGILSSSPTAFVRDNLNLNIVAALGQTPYGHLGPMGIPDPTSALARILSVRHDQTDPHMGWHLAKT